MRSLRRIAQIIFLLFFLYLFLASTYPLVTKIPVDLFLRSDPLIALSSIVSARSYIDTFVFALILLIITIPLGRYFCGWVCPLGTTLDVVSYITKNKVGKSLKKLSSLKYYLLIFLSIGILFASPLVWFLDPLSLLTRSLTLSLFPIVTLIFTQLFNLGFRMGTSQDFLANLQLFLSSTLLPTTLTFFRFSGWILLILSAIIFSEFISRRFWCRNLCPLGAFYAFFSRYQILRRRVKQDCNLCGDCQRICKMDAIPDDFKMTKDSECILCYDCVKGCPPKVTNINFRSRSKPLQFDKLTALSEVEGRFRHLDLSKRGFLFSLASGLISVGLLKTSFKDRNLKSRLIRPPGSREESEFLERCIRCHQCVKVCSTSGRFLQPSFLEGGFEALWTPIGVARYGYCEYNCVMCTQVCPTGAIHKLDLKTKKKTVIGLAYIDRSRCIPWYKNEKCIVCEEQCPVPDKAILLKEEKAIGFDGTEKKVLRPYVKEDLCIGCGICETKCPVEGESAIKITPQNEQRWKD